MQKLAVSGQTCLAGVVLVVCRFFSAPIFQSVETWDWYRAAIRIVENFHNFTSAFLRIALSLRDILSPEETN